MKKIKLLLASLLFVAVSTGCQVTETESDITVYNGSLTNTVYGVGIVPAGYVGTVDDQLGSTLSTYYSATIYGITNCDMNVDIYWTIDDGTYYDTVYLPCGASASFDIYSNGSYSFNSN